ncbi:galactose mutarotase-like protein [Mycena pura]|uniref:Galactose mutarotase-like protein n=1 Tax=Mycena pura TaxID=153505 RepID=A0AAD6YE10_9AGAR|nr:galactose mutarotase-like protein [Mycena pura]
MHTLSYFLLAFLAMPFDVTTISAPDGSINASLVAFGSTLTELWVKNKYGKLVDVVPGYDDNTLLLTGGRLCLNAVVGRYANRIENGTFTIPITKSPPPDGHVYHTPKNDHNGESFNKCNPINTLHGGIYGWDRRNWTVVETSPTSITYQHIDYADEGFPGIVHVTATHSVSNGGIFRTSMQATATEKTPIMLTQHIYWNLDGFQNGSDNVLAHNLDIPASRIIKVDSDGIPTGELVNVSGTPYDFRTRRSIGAAFIADQTFPGYDNAWIYDKSSGATAELRSESSGIRLIFHTNQPAVQVYLASLDMPRKNVHGGAAKQYGPRSTVAIEHQGWLDAINNPQWGVNQIYDAKREFTWNTVYKFSVEH